MRELGPTVHRTRVTISIHIQEPNEMKVILQRDVPKLGKGGDIVTVADGYARNYLLPRAYAVTATGGALREHTARADREKSRNANRLQTAQAEAEKLQALNLVIIGKANPGSTKLYGSITSQDVADQIAKETGVVVDKRRVGLLDPIKQLGDYKVPVRLHNDVSVTVPVAVLTEEGLAKRKAAEAAAAEAAARAAAEAPAADETEETEQTSAVTAVDESPVVTAESAETPAEEDTGEAADGAEAESAGEPL
jgi:large subunit ribosomal protein L9